MELRFNKGLSIILSIILILIYSFGQVLSLFFIDLQYPNSEYGFSTLDFIVTNISMVFSNLDRIVIGIWLFLIAERFIQEKWSWLLIGLAFGQYSLMLFAILLFFQSARSKVDIYKAIRPLLVLLIISFFLSPMSNFILQPYIMRILETSDYMTFTEYNSYLSFGIYGIVVLLNIILARRIYKLISKLQMKGKFLWAISTVLLGLFPVILFNELILIKTDNK